MKLYGITGWKNAGKTGLTERLVTEFTARGLRVSTVKHAHHAAEPDTPGTDSYRHRAAGARQVILASSARVALITELGEAPEPPLSELLTRLDPVDLVLVEGYKTLHHPKIEAFRQAAGNPLIAVEDETIQAVASDVTLDIAQPVFDLDDTKSIADFISDELGL